MGCSDVGTHSRNRRAVVQWKNVKQAATPSDNDGGSRLWTIAALCGSAQIRSQSASLIRSSFSSRYSCITTTERQLVRPCSSTHRHHSLRNITLHLSYPLPLHSSPSFVSSLLLLRLRFFSFDRSLARSTLCLRSSLPVCGARFVPTRFSLSQGCSLSAYHTQLVSCPSSSLPPMSAASLSFSSLFSHSASPRLHCTKQPRPSSSRDRSSRR